MSSVRLYAISIALTLCFGNLYLSLHADEPQISPLKLSFTDHKKNLLYAAQYVIAPLVAIIGIAYGIRHFFYNNLNPEATITEEEIAQDTLDFIILENNYTALQSATTIPELNDMLEKIEDSDYHAFFYIFNQEDIKYALKHKTNLDKILLKDINADVSIKNGVFDTMNIHKTQHRQAPIITSASQEALEALNLFWQAKQRYVNTHEDAQHIKTTNLIPKSIHWETELFNKLFKTLNEKALTEQLNGQIEYCVKTIKCQTAAIVAAYKEYTYQYNNSWTDCLKKYELPISSNKYKDRAKTQSLTTITELLADKGLTLTDINALVS